MTKHYGTPGLRALGPDCCTSEKLAACSLGAQLLFDRLIVQSDDQGRQHGEPTVVKAACFPVCDQATARKVEGWLDELQASGLVRWYSAGRLRLIQVEQWWRFQSGQRRAYPSRWPAPAGWEDRVYMRRTGNDSAGEVPADRGQSAGESPAKSRPLPLPLPLPVPLKASAAPAEPPAPKKPRKDPTGDHAAAIAHWHAEFLRTRGSPYAFGGKKDGEHVKVLLASSSLAEFKMRATALLESQDAFYAGADLGTLRSNYNKFAARRPPPRPGYDRPTEPEPSPGPKVDPAVAKRAIKDALAAAVKGFTAPSEATEGA